MAPPLPAAFERSVATPGWTVEAAAAKGATRTTMQDAVAIEVGVEAGWGRIDAAAVFDGVGGMPRGAEAAQAAATGLRQALSGAASAQAAVARLQAPVQRSGGATTAALATLGAAGAVAVAWCGDSGAYALESGSLRRLTRPDTAAGYITQCLGLDGVRPHAVALTLQVGDAVVLCSDGVDGVLDTDALQREVAGADGDLAAVRAVLAAVARAGAPDNAAVVVARRRA